MLGGSMRARRAGHELLRPDVAQGSDSDEEHDVSLNWCTSHREIESPRGLIYDRTGMTIREVLRSMAAARTAPESADLLELAELLATSDL